MLVFSSFAMKYINNRIREEAIHIRGSLSLKHVSQG